MPVTLDKRAPKTFAPDTYERLHRDFGSNAVSELHSLLTTKDAARVLGLSPAMLERLRWMREGPPFIRPTGNGRAVRYRWQDLLDWIERHRVDPERARQ